MPPKRSQNTSRPRKKPAADKLADELGLSTEEAAEIREAWEIFVDQDASEEAGEEAIVTADVRKVLQALGLESSREEMREIVETVDPEELGFVVYTRLLEVAALKMRYRDTQEEVEKAYRLFTSGTDGPIKLADLQRVARDLKEEVTDDQLRDMLAEACTKDIGSGVDIHDFEGVMKRAGVF